MTVEFRPKLMKYKFEDLQVWQLSLKALDKIYGLVEDLPESEKFNLKSQIIRACTSVSLNIAEGSTGQSNPEQIRFLGYSIRSLVEVIACLRIIEVRKYILDTDKLDDVYTVIDELFIKLQAFKKSLQ